LVFHGFYLFDFDFNWGMASSRAIKKMTPKNIGFKQESLNLPMGMAPSIKNMP